MPNRKVNLLIAGIAAATAAIPAYRFLVRPWHMRWGATDEELKKVLPGDELVPNPQLRVTHAITINARASDVWPWLVQMGQGRGGMYSYDWLENLFGLDFHSADRVLPEWQNLAVGDVMPLAPGSFGPKVALLEPNKLLVLHGDTRIENNRQMTAEMKLKPGDYFAVVWSFFLDERGIGTTRLVERFSLDYNPSLANRLFYRVALEPGSFIMERKMLLGIKARVEAQARLGEQVKPSLPQATSA